MTTKPVLPRVPEGVRWAEQNDKHIQEVRGDIVLEQYGLGNHQTSQNQQNGRIYTFK